MLAPSVFVARSTSTRGMGAPAARKIRRLETSHPPWPTVSVRSVRNGVDAMVKVTRSAAIAAAARLGSHTSCRTAVAPSRTGIISPYMNPVWCAMGEAISTTSSLPR